jgi:16S rRNA (cytidine1402-2'-O)-methyltransferase
LSGRLYLVATPIGNLGDLSARQAETLSSVDFIAAEDTRVSVKLLNHLGIKKPMISYFEHNKEIAGKQILDRLLIGESCALVTDAGTPAISDPGEDLVALCAGSGVEILSVPGCCAAISALAASGLHTGRFTFEGFLSTSKKSRDAHLASLKDEQRTMIFYEAPHKLRVSLSDMASVFGGERRISLCREMTKIYEETLRMTLDEAIAFYRDTAPKGEFVLVIEGAEPPEKTLCSFEDALTLVDELRAGGLSLRDAAKKCAADTGYLKNELYNGALEKR